MLMTSLNILNNNSEKKLQWNTDAGLPRQKYTVDSVTEGAGNSNYTAQRTVTVFLNM
jgi:hypothetical protein